MIFISLILYTFTSVLLCAAVYRKLSFSNLIITFFLTTFSENIIICQFLGIIHQLNNALFFILLQVFITAIITVFVFMKGKLSKEEFLFNPYPSKEKSFSLRVILIAVMAISFGVIFLIGINTPPNNLDSLHTHLTRIYYWLQHGSFDIWPATGIFQLTYPWNANIQGAWLFLFSSNENLFFLVAWFSLLVICVTVFRLGLLFNQSPNRALIGSLVFLTVPAATLQAYSFQNDLAVTALISITIYGLFSYLKTKQKIDLINAMLAFALALGVKQTAFMVLPIIFLTVIYFLIKRWIEKKHTRLILLFLLFGFVFSSFKYVQNIQKFGSVFGSEDLVSGQSMDAGTVLQKARYSVPRYIYSFISFDGLTSYQIVPLTHIKAQIFRSITPLTGINLEDEVFLAPGYNANERFLYEAEIALTEDTSWFGPLSGLLILIGIIMVLIKKDKFQVGYLIFSLLYFVSYFCAIILQRPGWDPYQGRYFILSLLPFFPLIGECIPKKVFWRSVVYISIITSYLFLSFNILFMNSSKPLITAGSVTNWQNIYILKLPSNDFFQYTKKESLLNISRALISISEQKSSIFDEDYYGQLFYSTSRTKKSIKLVNEQIPADQPIYLLTYRNPLEYALFGKNRSRNLYPVSDISEIPEKGYLLVDIGYTGKTDGFSLVGESNKIRIFHREK